MSQNERFEFSERLKLLPPYLFVEVDRMKQKAVEEGVDIINLGVGDPDIPTPGPVREVMVRALENPVNHQYPMGKGKKSYRDQIADFFKMRFDVSLDPGKEIHPLIGSKEGIAHFPLAFINPGDKVLVPEPAYPVYNSAVRFAGGVPVYFSLTEDNGFLPDVDSLAESGFDGAGMMFINYPNNPTGASCSTDFFRKLIEAALEHKVIIAHDAAYSEMYYADPPPSILQVPGAMETAVEFHSLSKTFSMTGWRSGWACGSAELVSGLAGIKDNIDSGVFGAVQDASEYALSKYEELTAPLRKTYNRRLTLMSDGLRRLGWKLGEISATFYIWARPPGNTGSAEAVKRLISEAGVVCTPGSGFGPSGEGYLRFALTRDESRINEALDRIGRISWQ